MSTRVSAVTAGARYRTEIASDGHAVVADEGPALGGADAGFSPFALVLAGLAACTGITLRMYAERKGWPEVTLAIELELHAGVDKTGPQRDRRLIRRQVTVTGAPDEAGVARLRDIVERTPVTLALKAGFDIETELSPA
jgi:putative redox protein